MLLVLALLGCAPRTAPVLYPEPMPQLSPAPAPELPVAADECPKAAPYLPGQAPPMVADGVVLCRAQVVPESQVLELVADADAAAYWEPVARACYDARAFDRLHAQSTLDITFDARLAAEREANTLRVAAPLAVTGAALLGMGIGLGVGYGASVR